MWLSWRSSLAEEKEHKKENNFIISFVWPYEKWKKIFAKYVYTYNFKQPRKAETSLETEPNRESNVCWLGTWEYSGKPHWITAENIRIIQTKHGSDG